MLQQFATCLLVSAHFDSLHSHPGRSGHGDQASLCWWVCLSVLPRPRLICSRPQRSMAHQLLASAQAGPDSGFRLEHQLANTLMICIGIIGAKRIESISLVVEDRGTPINDFLVVVRSGRRPATDPSTRFRIASHSSSLARRERCLTTRARAPLAFKRRRSKGVFNFARHVDGCNSMFGQLDVTLENRASLIDPLGFTPIAERLRNSCSSFMGFSLRHWSPSDDTNTRR